jgi:hypothetical protein
MSQSGNQEFYSIVTTDKCVSTLHIPDGMDPNRNAWLTITINYRLDFIDKRNPGGVVIGGIYDWKDGRGPQPEYYAYDSNKTDPAHKSTAEKFYVDDWDDNLKAAFEKKFKASAGFWNEKFLLKTPPNYSGLDYAVRQMPGFKLRPNVLCLYNLQGGGTPTHFPVKVLRTGYTNAFRSNSGLLDETDVKNNTIYHELWHSMEDLHIQGLLGDAACIAKPALDKCYVESLGPNEEPNITGDSNRGKALSPLNAKPWIELIAQHTKTMPSDWLASLNTKIGPVHITANSAAAPSFPRFR